MDLIGGSKLMIEPILATKLGLNEAIFIGLLHYWITKSKHKIDNKKWVFNSISSWQEQLPFLSERTIKRTIANLKELGFIVVKKMDKNPLNQTNWYSIDYKKIEELKKSLNIKTPKLKSKEKREKSAEKKSNEGAENYSELFLEFYKEFPRKSGGKKLAFIEFMKLDLKKQKLAISSAKKYALSVQTVEEKYIKTAKRWLKDEYYEDYEEQKDEASNTSEAKSLTLVDSLERKILYLLKIDYTQDIDVWEAKIDDKYIFTENEKDSLKKINCSLLEYQELNFEAGRIRTFILGELE